MADSTKLTSNLFWRFMERCGAQGVSFIVSIVLARILKPDVYGIIALITVFTSILSVFIDSGLGAALIQKKDADDLDFSTVFFFNIFMCLILYIIMYFCAPLIAKFYNITELTSVIRVLSLTLIIAGVKGIQISYVSKHLIFKKFFFATLGGTIGAAVVGIVMAYKGFGVWALVIQGLFNNFVDTIILWITVKWRPKFIFSFKRLKSLFSYGWKLLVSSLIDVVYNDIRQLIIGKMYTTEDLAFYNKGEQFPKIIIQNINSSIDSVLLPTMSESQDDLIRIKAMTRRAITVSTYVMMPMMMGLAVCAKPLVSLLLTDKWLFCVPYLRIFCFTYAFYPIHTANLNAIKAMGRSDLFLKLEIIKKIIGLVLLISTMCFGPLIMAYSLIFSSIASQLINSWPNKKLLNYNYLEQVKDMLPQILISCIMGIIIYCITLLKLSSILTLIIQIVLGIFIYLFFSRLFKIESFKYIISIIKKMKV